MTRLSVPCQINDLQYKEENYVSLHGKAEDDERIQGLMSDLFSVYSSASIVGRFERFEGLISISSRWRFGWIQQKIV